MSQSSRAPVEALRIALEQSRYNLNYETTRLAGNVDAVTARTQSNNPDSNYLLSIQQILLQNNRADLWERLASEMN